ncbi:MAG TPA: exopolysaccharide biosynthesis polyprenyl glycosylphosphotransferase [Rhizomicrobium sp.]|nr:exopolysaccharide biosynthesis polyprenyl glycosylphosphotransferase [Rhizomicrobium sp.]
MSIQGNLAEPRPRTLRLDATFPKLVVSAPARVIPQAVPVARPWVKRALDLFLAIPALILLSPVMLGIAILIVLDSRGPVFFRQTRTGLNGRPFSIFKFRSMSVLENGDHIMQARQNDPRVTRIGRVLRRTSLDELPQLLNVISGEMSLVGPRPHAQAHDRLYATLIGNYPQRQLAKPGITGWAQVHGLRGETPTVESMKARVDFDLWYVRNASFVLDVEILFRTVFEIFRRTNAY